MSRGVSYGSVSQSASQPGLRQPDASLYHHLHFISYLVVFFLAFQFPSIYLSRASSGVFVFNGVKSACASLRVIEKGSDPREDAS